MEFTRHSGLVVSFTVRIFASDFSDGMGLTIEPGFFWNDRTPGNDSIGGGSKSWNFYRSELILPDSLNAIRESQQGRFGLIVKIWYNS